MKKNSFVVLLILTVVLIQNTRCHKDNVSSNPKTNKPGLLLDSVYTFYITKVSTDSFIQSKQYMYYSSDGLDTSSLTYQYDTIVKHFYPFIKIRSFYDKNGNDTSELFYYGDVQTGKWPNLPGAKYVNFFDSNGQDTTSIQYLIATSNQDIPIEKDQYQYDKNGLAKSDNSFTWDNTNKEWLSSYSIDFLVDSKGRDSIGNDNYGNQIKYFYDSNGRISMIKTYRSNVLYNASYYSYDAGGNSKMVYSFPNRYYYYYSNHNIISYLNNNYLLNLNYNPINDLKKIMK